MAVSAGNIACFALLLSILALQVPSCIHDHERGTSAGTTRATTAASAGAASASAPPALPDGALKAVAMLALAGMDAVFIAAVVIYSRHTHHAAAGAGCGGNWRISSELAFFTLCLQVGVLQFVLFVPEHGAAAARELRTSAAGALPCVASVTFFLGTTLVYAAHAHVGNAGGGAVAGNGPVVPAPAAIRLLADMTLGAALVCLLSIVLALFYVNTKK